MKLTEEQKRKIVQELDPGIEDGIMFRLFEDLRTVFRGVVDDNGCTLGLEYTIDAEEMREFVRDIGQFDINTSGDFYIDHYATVTNRLDVYCLSDEETGDYFDFNRDVMSILEAIQNNVVVYDGKLHVNLEMVFRELKRAAENYMMNKLGIMPGYYYYEKDHYGTEKCYYVGEFVQDDQGETLYKLCNDGIPVETIRLGDWNNMQRDDEDNEFVQARNHTIRKALEEGMEFPMFLITHCHDDLRDKYEVNRCESCIDYEELIHEYAEPYAYKIEPTYIKGTEITREEAIQRGMYALAKEIEIYELKFLEKGEDND